MEEYLTVRDLVNIFKVTKFTISTWIKEKDAFPQPFCIGRKFVWKKSEIMDYLESTRRQQKDNNSSLHSADGEKPIEEELK